MSKKCRNPGCEALRADAHSALCLACKAAAQRERVRADKLAPPPEPERRSKRPRGPPPPEADTLMDKDMDKALWSHSNAAAQRAFYAARSETPEGKAAAAARGKLISAGLIAYNKTPVGKAQAKAKSAALVAYFQTPEGKADAAARGANISAGLLALFATPKGKAAAAARGPKISAALVAFYQTPEGKARAKATGARLAQLYKENIEAWRYVVGKINAKYEAAPLGQGSCSLQDGDLDALARRKRATTQGMLKLGYRELNATELADLRPKKGERADAYAARFLAAFDALGGPGGVIKTSNLALQVYGAREPASCGRDDFREILW